MSTRSSAGYLVKNPSPERGGSAAKRRGWGRLHGMQQGTPPGSLRSPPSPLRGEGLPRDEWLLDPDVAFLNHGSFGATPRAVLAEQERWRALMERHPTHFMSEELPPALRAAAERLAT